MAHVHREVSPVKSGCVNPYKEFALRQDRPRNGSALDTLGACLLDNHGSAHRIVDCCHCDALSRPALVQGDRCIANDFPHSGMIGSKQFSELIERYRSGIHASLFQSLSHFR